MLRIFHVLHSVFSYFCAYEAYNTALMWVITGPGPAAMWSSVSILLPLLSRSTNPSPSLSISHLPFALYSNQWSMPCDANCSLSATTLWLVWRILGVQNATGHDHEWHNYFLSPYLSLSLFLSFSLSAPLPHFCLSVCLSLSLSLSLSLIHSGHCTLRKATNGACLVAGTDINLENGEGKAAKGSNRKVILIRTNAKITGCNVRIAAWEIRYDGTCDLQFQIWKVISSSQRKYQLLGQNPATFSSSTEVVSRLNVAQSNRINVTQDVVLGLTNIADNCVIDDYDGVSSDVVQYYQSSDKNKLKKTIGQTATINSYQQTSRKPAFRAILQGKRCDIRRMISLYYSRKSLTHNIPGAFAPAISPKGYFFLSQVQVLQSTLTQMFIMRAVSASRVIRSNNIGLLRLHCLNISHMLAKKHETLQLCVFPASWRCRETKQNRKYQPE